MASLLARERVEVGRRGAQVCDHGLRRGRRLDRDQAREDAHGRGVPGQGGLLEVGVVHEQGGLDGELRVLGEPDDGDRHLVAGGPGERDRLPEGEVAPGADRLARGRRVGAFTEFGGGTKGLVLVAPHGGGDLGAVGQPGLGQRD